MDLKNIGELIKIMSGSTIKLLEIKEKDIYIKLEKEDTKVILNDTELCNNSIRKENVVKVENQNTDKEECCDENINSVTSPIVGTFYKSPSPDKEAFVKVGDKVKKGDVLCIIEAMKLMNEIKSDVDGTIEKVLAKDGQLVEYGMELFKISSN
ncbi:acetyl-CoA carboxylase, biotin carboxyl carrier protein [Clostridium tetani]|uniref:Biotin carboxyl carrier protein of acetyl-CoA carboxylase n=1 Tax=Clostridium tetani TaxID=1513 RepID=A0A4Q0VBM1_CLOTA|nr:acetyl-CoA carboxylase biotin carboxyl carrier protein [Clostridium tetani]AVP55705.1 acetyl-CoA carboxylase biotin carboxyl carrier protein [Clostridium tetani]KGI43467.1 acetyl-COA carboxylase [Clostridium tetani]RXI43514.1 acetyl-CoA carboxylase biotin carboxyl carrier protein [Clostridium tetani]RXI46623.1 acetyl-CoA carboxylase biotin carboxyl carrier protein [Clostridium tetani]RXI53213.1 acetyl-CoA carboxylase biotin carboxyl carrier protein [Clostridium tetani]